MSYQKLQNLKINWSTKKILVLILIFPFLAGNWSCAAKKVVEEKNIIYQSNKIIPQNIFDEAKIALSHYPELEDVEVEFRYKKKMKKALMQAQPKLGNLLKERRTIAIMYL